MRLVFAEKGQNSVLSRVGLVSLSPGEHDNDPVPSTILSGAALHPQGRTLTLKLDEIQGLRLAVTTGRYNSTNAAVMKVAAQTENSNSMEGMLPRVTIPVVCSGRSAIVLVIQWGGS
jgi:hypothetical protein